MCRSFKQGLEWLGVNTLNLGLGLTLLDFYSFKPSCKPLKSLMVPSFAIM